MSVGKGANTLDLAGRRFGRWTVLSWAGTDAQRGALWLCRCDCGTEKVVRRRNLITPGNTVSCGCHRKDMRRGLVPPAGPVAVPVPRRIQPLKPPEAPRTAETRKWAPDAPGRQVLRDLRLTQPVAGFTSLTHGLSQTPEYQSWKKMIARCYDPDGADFPNYGGRGIAVCEQWRNDPARFIADMGAKRGGFSVERIDVDGDYTPENCYWLPHRLQAKNRRPWKHTQEGLARIAEAQRKRHGSKA